MDYSKIFKKAFSEAVPPVSDEEAARDIIKRGNAMKLNKISPKRIIAATAAAAAVLMAGGVSVAAANGWNIADAFAGLFSAKAESRFGSEIGTYDSPVDFAAMGKELEITRGLNLHSSLRITENDQDIEQLEDYNATLTVRGVAADEMTVYIMYDIAFEDGLPEDIASAPAELLTAHMSHDIGPVGNSLSTTYNSGAYAISGNTVSFYDFIHLGTPDITFDGRTIRYTFNGLSRFLDDGATKHFYTGSADFEIPIDFELRESVIVETDMPMQSGDCAYTLESVKIGTFDVEFIFSTADYDALVDNFDGMYSAGEAVFLAEDGTEIMTHALSASAGFATDESIGHARASAIFVYPVNVEDIASVIINGQTFELK